MYSLAISAFGGLPKLKFLMGFLFAPLTTSRTAADVYQNRSVSSSSNDLAMLEYTRY